MAQSPPPTQQVWCTILTCTHSHTDHVLDHPLVLDNGCFELGQTRRAGRNNHRAYTEYVVEKRVVYLSYE